MSFPPATEMFQFAGFASRTYGFSTGYPSRGGLPHSEIPGSPIARISPGLVAACHVLHRLSVPRHPPDALTSRLSATPNGKNHRETRRCIRRNNVSPGNAVGRTMPRRKPGPMPPSAATFSPRRDLCYRRIVDAPVAAAARCAAGPRRLKTLSGPITTDLPGKPPLGPATDRSRLGHNSLIHICPSTSPRRSRTFRPGPAKGNLCFMPRIRVLVRVAPGCPRPPFGESCAFACRRDETCGFVGGGGERDRTDDLLLAKQALSQLSYTPLPGIRDQ